VQNYETAAAQFVFSIRRTVFFAFPRLIDVLRRTTKHGPGKTAPFDTLSGVLPDSVVKKNRPYLVTSDIEVPLGTVVVIQPGTTLCFKNFTTLHVHGSLLARGTKELPIFFTSENDIAYNPHSAIAPAAYDWNGITVYENGNGSTFKNCSVRYSLYGINSLTKFIAVDSCIFFQNGRSDLVIDGKKFENITPSFSYGTALSDTSLRQNATALPAKETTAETAKPATPLVPATQEHHTRRIVLRYSGASVFCAGAILGIWQSGQYRDSKKAFDNLNDTRSAANLKNPDILQEWDKAKEKKDNDLTGTMAGAAVALAGLLGFSLSFAF
jgi:hypothetical protein